MRNPLRILSIEDDPKDSKLIQDLLETEDIVSEVTRVDTQAALLASLEQGGIDLILADYSLPSFDGLSALKLSMEACRTCRSSLFPERSAKKWRLKRSKLAQRIMF